MIQEANPFLAVRREDEGIVIVTLDRAPANAISRDTYDQLRTVFNTLSRDPDVRAIVFTGNGRLFCGGNEVGDFVDLGFEAANTYLAHARLCYAAIYDCEVPVIGAINGAAAGTGLILASLCDIRVVSEKASFLLPEINIGLAGGACHLARLVGQGTARLMAYTGCKLGPEEARRVGLADIVVQPEDVVSRALELAREIAKKNPLAVRLAKAGLNRNETQSVKEGFEFECDLIATALQTPLAAEAIRSFAFKRSPAPASEEPRRAG
ncbi:enoyl-CoA hydratase/isomerase family protein [Enterovirga sp. CN4-39]|uniref:enoyl-CoA hydratase/isomerase family protein n=1 Tax=Enterovirga sp. CN4-39 TaxID=3400910 RepID=UPI003C08BC59